MWRYQHIFQTCYIHAMPSVFIHLFYVVDLEGFLLTCGDDYGVPTSVGLEVRKINV